MGDLRDQLKKARLLSEKDSRRLAHEARLQRAELGREGLEQQEKARVEALARIREEERLKAKRSQEEMERARKAEAELQACEDLLVREVSKPGQGGPSSRLYFQLVDGQLPWVEVTEGERRHLGANLLAIVRVGPAGSHTYRLMPMVHARRVAQCLADRVVWPPRMGPLPSGRAAGKDS